MTFPFDSRSSTGRGPSSSGRPLRDGALAVLLVMAIAACEAGGREPEPAAPPGVEVGHSPPALEGRLASGEPVVLNPSRGERTVILFYRGESCGLCRLRLEQLNSNLAAYSSLGARVVAVTLDPPEVSAQTAERLGGDLRIISVDSAVFREWEVLDSEQWAPLPGAYVLDDRGVVLFRHLGSHAGDRVSDATLLTVLDSEPR
jgi:mycoredoxin-dependent peroxiredoxin